MKDSLRWRDRLLSEDGQDVVEYALVITLVGFSAIVCMKGFASTISSLANIGASIISTL